MTRKTCLDHLHVGITLKSVCHELLRNSPWSLSLPKVYKTLDTLLNENGMKLRNKMPRTRARSMCYKLKQSPLSLTNYSNRLRTRRHTAYVNSYLDTSGDDDSNHVVTPVRELRSSNRVSQIKVESDLDVWESGRPKRTCITKKRGSADERLMFDNRNYYKVEVLSNKLRSVRERKIKSPIISEDSEDDKVYSFPKKKKQSEITRLNNEAENFLFPHKSDSSSDETDVTDPPPPQSTRKRETNENVKPKVIKADTEDGSMDSNSSESSVKKKRRLTQAEAFILDNQRYYKFETPGSRLRYQGSYLSPITTKNNGEYGIKHSRIKEPETKPSLKLEDLKFAFEMVPNAEPWYSTFQRQDKGQECYTCYNYFAGYKPFLLPYEMGPLPSLNPRVCFYAYKQMRKEILGDTGPSASEACSTPDADIIKTDYNSSCTGEDTKSSEDVSVELVPQKVFRKTKRRKVLSGKNPRKSPRQHASTLAILSSLIHQRKRREYKCRVSHQSKNLSVIVEEKEETEPDYDVLSKSIDDMLSNSYNDMNLMDRLVGDEAIDVHCKSNAIECLDDYIRGENGDVRKAKNNPRGVARKPPRKKKKNRTGWPNKNKRQTFRKEGSDSRDGVESIKNSRIDSGTEESSSDNNLNKSKDEDNLSNKLLNVNKLNGDVQVSKFNGELYFKNVGVPKRKEHRESSSDNCVEVVIPSVGDKIDCVNVDLAKWENAEKLLAAKIRCENINNDILFQPIVRVQKLDSNIEEKCIEKQFSVSTPKQNRRSRRMPASPKSPRMLRRPRGRWY